MAFYVLYGQGIFITFDWIYKENSIPDDRKKLYIIYILYKSKIMMTAPIKEIIFMCSTIKHFYFHEAMLSEKWMKLAQCICHKIKKEDSYFS